MKKLLALILAIAMLATLAACGSTGDTGTPSTPAADPSGTTSGDQATQPEMCIRDSGWRKDQLSLLRVGGRLFGGGRAAQKAVPPQWKTLPHQPVGADLGRRKLLYDRV